ncbi:hypothetical protein V8F06_013098, partial [Rhypophila decipiens]
RVKLLISISIIWPEDDEVVRKTLLASGRSVTGPRKPAPSESGLIRQPVIPTETTSFDFDWFIPEDKDEEGYQQMIDRTSTLSLTTDTQETTRRNDTDDDGRKEFVEFCEYVCGWEAKMSIGLPEDEAEKCSMGCERVCNVFRLVEDLPDSGQRFGDDEDSSPTLNSIKQDITGLDPDRMAAVMTCQIVCEFQWLYTPQLSLKETRQCGQVCDNTCDAFRVIDLPPRWRSSSSEDSGSEDEDPTV